MPDSTEYGLKGYVIDSIRNFIIEIIEYLLNYQHYLAMVYADICALVSNIYFIYNCCVYLVNYCKVYLYSQHNTSLLSEERRNCDRDGLAR